MGCHLWGRTVSDMTEVTQQQQQQIYGLDMNDHQLFFLQAYGTEVNYHTSLDLSADNLSVQGHIPGIWDKQYQFKVNGVRCLLKTRPRSHSPTLTAQKFLPQYLEEEVLNIWHTLHRLVPWGFFWHTQNKPWHFSPATAPALTYQERNGPGMKVTSSCLFPCDSHRISLTPTDLSSQPPSIQAI